VKSDYFWKTPLGHRISIAQKITTPMKHTTAWDQSTPAKEPQKAKARAGPGVGGEKITEKKRGRNLWVRRLFGEEKRSGTAAWGGSGPNDSRNSSTHSDWHNTGRVLRKTRPRLAWG